MLGPDEAGGLGRQGACSWYGVLQGVSGLWRGAGPGALPAPWRCAPWRCAPRHCSLWWRAPWRRCVQAAYSAPCQRSHTLLRSWLFRSGAWLVFYFSLVFLQLLSSLLQLSMQLIPVSPTQFLRSSLLEERFVSVQAPQPSEPGPGLSHCCFNEQNQLQLKSASRKEKMRGSFSALKGQFPRNQADIFKLINDQTLLSPASEEHPVDSLQNLEVVRLGKLEKLA